ncbi:MAG: succinylglutamate desuccinylase/aspartoacylase family protein [Gammaproteobacteria bacterium]|nr:succinylglutamate desuccinylase/aspartoacylase family protein [Gammaproteobacteria bacterium]
MRKYVILLCSCFLLPAHANQKIITSETFSTCQRIAKKLASVSLKECLHINPQTSGWFSRQGTPILIKEYPPLKNKTAQAKILLIGGTHGDELSSVSVTFKWMQKLEKYHSGLFHWRVVPMMNPDGVLKKRATRTNANGVDLNRNLPSPSWDKLALKYWQTKTKKNKRRYPGPTAASEPETQWLVDEINTFQPNVIISVHAPLRLVDFDSDNLKQAPRRIGPLRRNLMGTYPGSLGNYAGRYLDIPVMTLELPHGGIMPSKQQITHLWVDLVRWLKKNAHKPDIKVMQPALNKQTETGIPDYSLNQ